MLPLVDQRMKWGPDSRGIRQVENLSATVVECGDMQLLVERDDAGRQLAQQGIDVAVLRLDLGPRTGDALCHRVEGTDQHPDFI